MGHYINKKNSAGFQTLAVVSICLVFFALYLPLFRNSLIDDAMITAQYARNLSESGTWGLFSGVLSNTATSPMNVLVLTLFSLVTPGVVYALLVACWVEFALLAFGLWMLSRELYHNSIFYFFTLSGLLFNPLMVSTIGLETYLYVLFFVYTVVFFLRGRFHFSAAFSGLLTLTRPDGIILFLVLLIFLPFYERHAGREMVESYCIKRTFGRLLSFGSVYAAIMLPWFLYSWVRLGSFVPETLFIKMGQKWGDLFFYNGLKAYWNHYPFAMGMTVYPVLFMLLIPFMPMNRKPRYFLGICALFAALYYTGYSILRVPPYHWYYGPVVSSLILLGGLGLSGFYERFKSGRMRMAGILSGLIPMAGFLYFPFHAGQCVLEEVPIHTNWASHAAYKEVGEWLQDNIPEEQSIRLQAELGTLLFYSNLKLVDYFSTEENLVRVMEESESKSGLGRTLGVINFFWWKPKGVPNRFAYELKCYPYASTNILDTGTIKTWRLSSSWIPESTLILTSIEE